MNYHLATFYGETTTGKDELGNDTTQPVHLGDAASRIVKWTSEDVELLGRELTSRTVKLITRAKLLLLSKSRQVEMLGDRYNIVQVSGSIYDRWRILVLERMR